MKKNSKTKSEDEQLSLFVHSNTYHIYTDGSYRPDGNAAFAYLIYSERSKSVVRMEAHACRGRTINQMELEAINHALSHPGMDHVIIHSDSAYSISCLTLWYKSWERNNWLQANGEPVKNKQLIQDILAKMKSKKFVRFMKVKSHSGVPFNTVVDHLAQRLTHKMRENPSLPDGYHAI